MARAWTLLGGGRRRRSPPRGLSEPAADGWSAPPACVRRACGGCRCGGAARAPGGQPAGWGPDSGRARPGQHARLVAAAGRSGHETAAWRAAAAAMTGRELGEVIRAARRATGLTQEAV